MASVSQWERETIAERTASALRHKRAQRRVFNHEPYGYRRNGDELMAEPEEQATIDRMREWRTSGWTLRQVADELNSAGTPTKRAAGRWHPQTVKNILGNDLCGRKTA
jgi:DNA invertase Pin-like site-specific DNA recombinase